MAIRNIITNDDKLLKRKSKEVENFDDRLKTLIDDLIETLHNSGGAGLAAPQVGILKRVVVIDIGDGVIELVNPEIISTKGKQKGGEGCLSYPGIYGVVERPMKVKVRAFDRDGNPFEIKGEELLARAFCHEIDHLNGIVFKELTNEFYREKD